MNTHDFIAAVAPVAVQLRREGSPVFASVRIAQAALETGWTLNKWNNLVGFKVGSGETNAYWKGNYYYGGTWEVYDGKRKDIMAAFRAYDSIASGFRDQDLLFTGWNNYRLVCAAKTPEEQCRAFMKTPLKYATDPDYAEKLLAIMDTHDLKAHDEEETTVLSAEDANKIILFLSAAYMSTTVQEARDEFHRLANELRKASGQPEA
ncbi:MAG: glucosaminidase domain-containing protein [Paenibacillaceae bacterium]|nr:glucosaminidase domain-containing protein [Paenibacillaceae bacterium]